MRHRLLSLLSYKQPSYSTHDVLFAGLLLILVPSGVCQYSGGCVVVNPDPVSLVCLSGSHRADSLLLAIFYGDMYSRDKKSVGNNDWELWRSCCQSTIGVATK